MQAGSQAVVAHEALLRWIRPSGIVSPLDFIPLAETSGLIVSIGRCVLRQAVDAVKTGWLQRVPVNVSALEIRQLDFAKHLRWILMESGVEPQRVLLELMETSMLEPRFAAVLKEINALGVQTSPRRFRERLQQLGGVDEPAGAGGEDRPELHCTDRRGHACGEKGAEGGARDRATR
nr:EAL domain-containing protein [Deinococcus psychrotolerans]